MFLKNGQTFLETDLDSSSQAGWQVGNLGQTDLDKSAVQLELGLRIQQRFTALDIIGKLTNTEAMQHP